MSVFDPVPLKEFIGASLYPQKVAASLMVVLGSIAVLLAGIGIYSVMGYWLAQRTQEIGVRMALGARPAQVLALVVKQGLMLSTGGLVAGAALALALSRAASSLSFTNSAMGSGANLMGARAADPFIYIGAALFLCLLSALAAYVPARRAASIDPVKALRTD